MTYNALGRRRRTGVALPALFGKRVEVERITPIREMAHGSLYDVVLYVDGFTYRVRMFGKDEMEVYQRLLRLQQAKPRSVFHEDSEGGD